MPPEILSPSRRVAIPQMHHILVNPANLTSNMHLMMHYICKNIKKVLLSLEYDSVSFIKFFLHEDCVLSHLYNKYLLCLIF